MPIVGVAGISFSPNFFSLTYSNLFVSSPDCVFFFVFPFMGIVMHRHHS